MLGTPNEMTWPGVSELPDYKDTFPKWRPQPLQQAIPSLDPAGIDLLQRMLTYCPSQRITAYQALQHEFFMDLYTEPLLHIQQPPPMSLLQMQHSQDVSGYMSSMQSEMARQAMQQAAMQQSIIQQQARRASQQHSNYQQQNHLVHLQGNGAMDPEMAYMQQIQIQMLEEQEVD
jgi:serine/threonine protein kinase